MSRPPRTPNSNEDFKDPLDNYDAKSFADPLEQALQDEPVTDLWTRQVACVGPDATIEQAMEKMNAFGTTCVLVIEEEKLIGVLNERNVLDEVAHRYHDIKSQTVDQVMTRDPVVLWESDMAGTALGAVGVGRVRHIPVLDVDGRVLGVASPRCIVAFLHRHFVE